MILGIGTDIAEIPRIARSVENISFKERVFSKLEIAYCESKANSAESFAARFAAKEAFFKAIGTGWRGGMAFNEVEVVNDELGKPTLNIIGETANIIKEKNIRIIHVSLSHVKDVAMATVVLEG
jgi:holo-[acyl-carrier protein] synthase